MLIDKQLIQQAKEKLGDDNFTYIMEYLGVEDYDNKNKRCVCPFHSENTASFVYNPKSYSFHCFGCQKNVDIIDGLMYKGFTYIEAVQKLFELADIKYSFGEHKIKSKYQYRYPKEVECTNKDKVYEYWNRRGISQKTLDRVDVREDQYGNTVFNYYDLNDVLLLAKYRPSKKINKGEVKCWCQKDADTTPILFNMNRINTSKPLLITSGEGDCLSAIEAGYLNSVSIPLGDGNTQWVQECWDFLEEFDQIYICTDNDESGIKFQKDIIYRLGSWRTKIIEVPEFYKKSDGIKVRIKDLNEVLYWFGKEKVLELINNAKDTPIPSLVNFSDVNDIDLQNMDGIEMGFTDIDKDLYKLFFGSFNVVSGIPGSGKTSFLYGLCANALDQNINNWVFSRELPTWMSKSWLFHIIGGGRNHTKTTGKDGRVYYNVSKEAKSLMNKHYDNKLFFYRDDYPNDVESLKESMESAFRKYNCRLFILDNLMMVELGGNNEDKNEIQTKFINWLIQFSIKFQVCTVLCCHPNKTQEYTQSVGMYQIAGTSNIINLAHRAFGLRRITKKEKEGYTEGKAVHAPVKHDVVINIIKDRFTGKSSNEYNFLYNGVDRRFYSNQAEYDKKYSWDTKNYTEPNIAERLYDETNEVFGEIKNG